jgi:hypothetical protein
MGPTFLKHNQWASVSFRQLQILTFLMTKLLRSAACLPLFVAGIAHANVDFKKDILPIFESRCVKCHKAPHEENGKMQKPKGDLQLDAAWAILKGGEDGPIVKPGNSAKSALIEVVTLPVDDDKFMPPQNKGEPLKPEEIAKLKAWIDEGVDFGGWEGNLAGKPADAPSAIAKKAPAKEREHDAIYQKLSEGLQPASPDLLKKATEVGAQTTALMVGGPLLRVDFLTGVSKCDDKAVVGLMPLKDYIAHLDLARTSITNAALKTVAQFPRLTELDLRNTKINDDGLTALTTLKNLDEINLFGTEVTDKGLATLAAAKSLKHIYLYETKVTEAGVSKLKTALPKAEIVWNIQIADPGEKPVAAKGKKKK